MKISVKVLTPSGVMLEDRFDHFVADGDEGQVGIFENHIPILLKITDGYLKFVGTEKNTFVVVSNGILDFKQNVATIVAENVEIGENLEETKKELHLHLKERLKESKQQFVDFVGAEKELARTIQEVVKNKI